MKNGLQQSWIGQQPFTAVAISISILLPLVGLLWTRQRLQQNPPLQDFPFQLARQSRLIQSFIVDPDQAVPAIWSSRLGEVEAASRWTSSARQLWWLAWLEDGQPLLLLSGANRTDAPTFHFADELHREAYEKKRSNQGLKPSSLERDCLSRLNSTTAVMWSSSALVSIAGPAASLMNEVSHGCLSLSLKTDRLRFRGPVASRPLSAAPAALSSPETPGLWKLKTARSDQSVQSPPLLKLRSRSSERLLSILARREVIRSQLETRYGVSPRLLGKLLQAPLQLTIQPETTGPYQAGLQVVFDLESSQKKAAEQTLGAISSLLRDRGLTSKTISIPHQSSQHADSAKRDSEKREPENREPEMGLLWLKGDQPIGGWSLQGDKTSFKLQLALGQPPLALNRKSPERSSVDLTAKMLPSKLAAIGWIGPGWPKLVREAKALDLLVRPMKGNPAGLHHWDWLEGELSLR